MSSALIFDCVILAIAAVFGIVGIMAGLMRELSGLCGVLVGVFASTKYADEAGGLLVKYGFESQNPTMLKLCGFLVIFIVVWGAFIIAGRLLAKILKISGLGALDHLCGFIFGAAKFLIIAAVIASCINIIPFLNTHVREYLADSTAWPLLTSVGERIAHTDELGDFGVSKNKPATTQTAEILGATASPK